MRRFVVDTNVIISALPTCLLYIRFVALRS